MSRENKSSIKWGIEASFNMSMPGKWTSFKRISDPHLGYGGGIGGLFRKGWSSDWFLEVGASVNYENIRLNLIKESEIELSRCTMSCPVTVGRTFEFTDRLKVSPLAGIDISHILANHLESSPEDADFDWNPISLSWGIGAEFLRDNIAVSIMGYLNVLKVGKVKSIHTDSSIYANKTIVALKYYF